ncbi:hypothetical protein ACQ4PT_068973 [Festuca glaucescens]
MSGFLRYSLELASLEVEEEKRVNVLAPPLADRTAILSRRRRPLWLRTDTLNLDSRSYWNPDPWGHYDSPPASQVKARLFSDAGTALRAAGRRPVRKTDAYRDPAAYDHVAALLAVQELLHIEELRLGFKSVDAGDLRYIYELDATVLPGRNLRVLDFARCRIKPPPGTGADVLPCLSVLRLYKCSSSTKDLEDFISATRSLRALHIENHDFYSYGDCSSSGDRFVVNSPSVTAVTLVGLKLTTCKGIELDTPSLCTFKYNGQPVDFSVKSPVTELARVEIDLTPRPRYYDDPKKAWFDSLWQFLRNLPHMRILKLNVLSIEGIAVEHEHLVTLHTLERLEIQGPSDQSRRNDAATAIANLLQSCPVIHDLHIRIVNRDYNGMVVEDVSPPHFDVSLDLFERRHTKEIRAMIDGEHSSPVVADLPGLTGCRFNCLQNHLKNVKLQFVLKEMDSFEISLAKFLAENCSFLRKGSSELNFPLGSESVPELFSPPSHGRAARIAREDQEAWERIKAEAAGEGYMAELRRLNPGRVAPEAQRYAEYAARTGLASSAAPVAVGPSSSTAASSSSAMAAASSSAPAQGVIDLCNSDDSDDSFNAWLDGLND